MPKFSLDINGVSAGAAEGREAWAGEVPPTGTYKGILKVVQIKEISQDAKVEANRGKPKLNIGVELTDCSDPKFNGYLTWNNLNLVDSSIPYINQFLLALTDGSDSQFEAIKKAFYAGFVTDDRKQHVTAIGKWKINSPEGTIPVLVSCKKRGYKPAGSDETAFVTDISSFLIGAGGAKGVSGATSPAETVVEEEATIVVEDEEEPDVSGESVFEEVEEEANA